MWLPSVTGPRLLVSTTPLLVLIIYVAVSVVVVGLHSDRCCCRIFSLSQVVPLVTFSMQFLIQPSSSVLAVLMTGLLNH